MEENGTEDLSSFFDFEATSSRISFRKHHRRFLLSLGSYDTDVLEVENRGID
jgi:hypothetical protein